MRAELYEWMKNLTFFYVIFQAAQQLLPDKKYEKYVRFYMGLLMIILMLSPMFFLLGNSGELWESFVGVYEKEEWNRLKKEAENMKEYYLITKEKWEKEWEIDDSEEKRGD